MNENDRSILVNLRREEMVTVYHMSAEFKLFKLLVSIAAISRSQKTI